jgi:hypothetical protein
MNSSSRFRLGELPHGGAPDQSTNYLRFEASIDRKRLNSLGDVTTVVRVHLSWNLFVILTPAWALARFGGDCDA